MKNFISLVNKKKGTLDDRNSSVPESSSGIIHQRGALNTEDFEEGKKDGAFELGHLEFTTNSAQLGDSDDDNDNAIKIANAATDEANEANSEEKSMTLRQALRKYPKAALWSILVSTTCLLYTSRCV